MRVRWDHVWQHLAVATVTSVLLLASLGAVSPAATAATARRSGFAVPATSTQIIVGVASDWGSSHVTLQRFERKRGGPWKPAGERFEGRLGASGLAWGRGVHPLDPMPEGVKAKREGDNRSPAGVFTLGQAFGFDPDVTRHPTLKYLQVTPFDLFVDDPASPLYNAHIRLDHLPGTPWEISQQMEQSNPAHALELVINHNVTPHPVPGAGSAILFHIWRKGGASNTAGCTTMDERDLRDLVAWVDPQRNPLYVLLPQSTYDSLAPSWLLPKGMTSADSPVISAEPSSSVAQPVPVAAPPVTKAIAPSTTRVRHAKH